MTVHLENHQEVRQLVDWRAAVWAGVVAGIAFLLLYLFVAPIAFGGSDALTLLRYQAAIVLGAGNALSSATPIILLIALVVNFVVSIFWAVIIAIIIHRWGMIIGILLGGLLGLGIYGINFFAFLSFFPWFGSLNVVNAAFVALIHIIFGAFAGGVYEFLEVEYFVPIND